MGLRLAWIDFHPYCTHAHTDGEERDIGRGMKRRITCKRKGERWEAKVVGRREQERLWGGA